MHAYLSWRIHTRFINGLIRHQLGRSSNPFPLDFLPAILLERFGSSLDSLLMVAFRKGRRKDLVAIRCCETGLSGITWWSIISILATCHNTCEQRISSFEVSCLHKCWQPINRTIDKIRNFLCIQGPPQSRKRIHWSIG